MKTILVIALITPLILAAGYTEAPCVAGQSLYKYKCVNNSCFDTYIPRFQTVANAELVGGVGKIPITFVGTVEFVTGTGDVKVSVQFTDKQNDGLANRDNTLSCLDSRLKRFGSDKYSDGTDYTNTITSNYDTANLYRQWSWTIKGSDLKTVLIQDNTEAGYITFVGYFGLEFYVVDEVQVAYYFTFRVKVVSDMSKSIETSFKGLVEKGAATCNPSGTCIARADSSLVFCNKPGDCATTTPTKILYLNQRFSVLQKITTPGFETFFLIPKALTFSGAGLNRVAKFESPTKTAGQAEIQASVEFAYNAPVTVAVQSVLSTVSGRRMLIESNRFLQTAEGSTVSGAIASQTADATISGSYMIAVLSVILFIMF